MKIKLPNAVSTRLARQILVAQKNSPQMLFASGIVLMGATVVSACRATLQLEDILEDVKKERWEVNEIASSKPEKYSEKDVTKLNVYITTKGMVKILKVYTPTILFASLSVAALTSSHQILSRRNAGLSAALAATERAMASYRDRVREEIGEDRELAVYRGEKTETVPVLDDEGRETKSKKKVKTGGGHSPYARVWGRDTSNEWDPIPEYSLAKLRSVQTYCNIKLESEGHLFLNEVFDELGLSRTPAGAVVGWLSKKNGGADGFVDLGVLSQGEEVKYLDFVTGHEDHIMLDFNVDGEIFRRI